MVQLSGLNMLARILVHSSRISSGGELKAYTELLGQSRDQAVQRMLEEAVGRGANAVVNVRIATSAITPGASEILAYGTAVVVE